MGAGTRTYALKCTGPGGSGNDLVSVSVAFVPCIDSDGDDYGDPASPTCTFTTLDCDDSAGGSNVHQNIGSLSTDTDQDGWYTTAPSTQCVGDTSVISGRTYYKDTNGSFTWLLAVEALGTSDCASSDSLKWRNRYLDGDGDTFTIGGAQSVCSGSSLASGWRASSNPTDCNDSCPTCFPGSTAFTASLDGKDQNCNGQIDENTGVSDKFCPSTISGETHAITRVALAAACTSYCTGGSVSCRLGTIDKGPRYEQWDFGTCARSDYTGDSKLNACFQYADAGTDWVQCNCPREYR